MEWTVGGEERPTTKKGECEGGDESLIIERWSVIAVRRAQENWAHDAPLASLVHLSMFLLRWGETVWQGSASSSARGATNIMRHLVSLVGSFHQNDLPTANH